MGGDFNADPKKPGWIPSSLFIYLLHKATGNSSGLISSHFGSQLKSPPIRPLARLRARVQRKNTHIFTKFSANFSDRRQVQA